MTSLRELQFLLQKYGRAQAEAETSGKVQSEHDG